METITACENVCRDFSWLGPWVPALLASITALLIAFVAYPWQKEKDRKLQVALEKRAIYREFVEAAHAILSEPFAQLDGFLVRQGRLLVVDAKIKLSAPKKIVGLSSEFRDICARMGLNTVAALEVLERERAPLEAKQKALFWAANAKLEATINAMRQDTLNGTIAKELECSAAEKQMLEKAISEAPWFFEDK